MPPPKRLLPDSPVRPYYNPYLTQAKKFTWLASIRDKFQWRHHGGTTANLNQARFTLVIPFLKDPYGSLRYFANKPSDFTSEAAFQAYSTALTSPHAFLHIANSKYDTITPFGHTHSSRTSEKWAAQIFGLNFVVTASRFSFFEQPPPRSQLLLQLLVPPPNFLVPLLV